MLKQCPICFNSFSGHWYAMFATVVFVQENKVLIEKFLSALEQHNWKEAAQFQDWDPVSDDLEAYALKCSSGNAALVIIESPYELYYNNSLMRIEVLSSSIASDFLSSVASDRWRPFASYGQG